MNAAEMLDECRARWDWPQGKLAQMQARLTRHRDFNTDCQDEAIPPARIPVYRGLLEQGRVVWGAVVGGDDLVTEPGTDDRPVRAVYGMTPFFDRRVDTLQQIAGQMEALRRIGEPVTGDPDRYALAQALMSDAELAPRELPMTLAGGHTGVCVGTIIAHRRRLPTGRLTVPALPLVVCPERTLHAMPLPLRYWSPEVIKLWHEEASGKMASVRVTLGAIDDVPSPPPLLPPDPDAFAAPLPEPTTGPDFETDPRTRYLLSPLRVTPEAAKHFARWLKREKLTPRDAMMTVLVRATTPDQIDYRVSITPRARITPDDVVSEAGVEGVRLVVPGDALAHLTGKLVDYRPDAGGNGFIVRSPGDWR